MRKASISTGRATGRLFTNANGGVAHPTSTHMRNATNYNLFLINSLSLPTNNKSPYATLIIHTVECLTKEDWRPVVQIDVHGSTERLRIQKQMQGEYKWYVNREVKIDKASEIRLREIDTPNTQAKISYAEQYTIPDYDYSCGEQYSVIHADKKDVYIILGRNASWYRLKYSTFGTDDPKPKEADTSDLLNDDDVSATPQP